MSLSKSTMGWSVDVAFPDHTVNLEIFVMILLSQSETKSSQNTDVGKTCSSREFLMLHMSFNTFLENKILEKIVECSVLTCS